VKRLIETKRGAKQKKDKKKKESDEEGDEFSFVDEHIENDKQIKCRKIPTLTHLKLCNLLLLF
jgi:hypothetical protein